jgi:hypothetical protein
MSIPDVFIGVLQGGLAGGETGSCEAASYPEELQGVWTVDALPPIITLQIYNIDDDTLVVALLEMQDPYYFTVDSICCNPSLNNSEEN